MSYEHFNNYIYTHIHIHMLNIYEHIEHNFPLNANAAGAFERRTPPEREGCEATFCVKCWTT